MKILAKVIDYSSNKPRGHTLCLSIDKGDAGKVPYDENLPPRRYVPITLVVNGVVYDARLFARPKVPYVWISTTLKRNGRLERLATVLTACGIDMGDRVQLEVVGAQVTLI
ncbi:MAG: hypothetical protein AB7V39_13735 [Nitrospiraceae bacterium]